MRNKKGKVALKIIFYLFIIAFAAIAVDAFLNKKFINQESISEYDNRALKELNMVYGFDGEAGNDSFWKDFKLSEHPVLLISKESHYSYLINPTQKISSFFTKKLKDFEKISSSNHNFDIYRISRLCPKILKEKLMGGNFNTIGKVTSVMGNDVYYIKFDSDNFTKKYSSNYLVNFLYHESFHYFMQNNWLGGDRFSGELNESDMNLLYEKLKLLDEAKNLIKNNDKDKLIEVSKKIVEVEEKRKKTNPEYVEKENMMETIEGTATYMGIRASHVVDYDFGPMYFDNVKDIPFSDVIPTFKEGKLDEGFLRDRLPYETGAQITLILDELDKEHKWQIYLNEQTIKNSRTLVDALKETLKVN